MNICQHFLPHQNNAQVTKPMDMARYAELLSDPYVKIWFVSDLHFGDVKQLQLERTRHQLPFKNKLSHLVTQYPKEVVDSPEFREILFKAMKDQYHGRQNLFMGKCGFRVNKRGKYNVGFGRPAIVGNTALDKPITFRPVLKRLLEEMDKLLIEQWNKHIAMNDLVFFLGDLVCNRTQSLPANGIYPKDIKRTHQILSQLNGNIVLIEGNHDNQFKNNAYGLDSYLFGRYQELTINLPMPKVFSPKDIENYNKNIPVTHSLPDLHIYQLTDMSNPAKPCIQSIQEAIRARHGNLDFKPDQVSKPSECNNDFFATASRVQRANVAHINFNTELEQKLKPLNTTLSLHLSHYPKWEWEGMHKNKSIHLHGHVHTEEDPNYRPKTNRALNLSWDKVGRPINLAEILNMVNHQQASNMKKREPEIPKSSAKHNDNVQDTPIVIKLDNDHEVTDSPIIITFGNDVVDETNTSTEKPIAYLKSEHIIVD